jgi:hypothetical protein
MFLVLRNVTSHYHDNKRPSLDFVLSQMNPVYMLAICLFKYNFSSILQLTPKVSEVVFLRFAVRSM